MKPQTDAADYAAQATTLQGQLTRHLRNRGWRDNDIARKVSHGSRNQRGARTFEAFTSVIQTLRRTSSLSIGTAFEQIFAPLPQSSP